jgi:hypothetical protein
LFACTKARSMGVDISIAEYPNSVELAPLAELLPLRKGGAIVFTTTPLEALEHAAKYVHEFSCRNGARAIAALYGTPQGVWRLDDGSYIHCAEELNVPNAEYMGREVNNG